MNLEIPTILFYTIFVNLVYFSHSKNITNEFGAKNRLENIKEVVYLRISQSDHDVKTSLKVYFTDRYLHIITYVTAVFTSHIDEDKLCANYRVGFKIFQESNYKSVWNDYSSTQCYCLLSPVCKPGTISVYNREAQQPLDIEIDIFSPSDYESRINITLIPAVEIFSNSCANGMKPLNYSSKGVTIRLCPVRFQESDVPLAQHEHILSLIGTTPKSKIEDKTTTNYWPVYVAVFFVILLILGAILAYFLIKRKLTIDERLKQRADTVPMIQADDNYAIQNSQGTLSKNNLKIYRVGLQKLSTTEQGPHFFRIEIRENLPFLKSQELTIMLVGIESHGKNTLINGFLNFLCGVEFRCPHRFQLQVPKSIPKTDIVIYEIWSSGNCSINNKSLVVNVIDAPSFKPDKNSHNEIVMQNIRTFFQTDRCIDALCYVAKWKSSSFNDKRLPFLDELKAICGVSEIYLLNTFLDQNVTDDAISGQLGMSGRDPFSLIKRSHKKKIETAALFKDNLIGEVERTESDWEIGMDSIRKFLEQVIKNQQSLAIRIARRDDPNLTLSNSGSPSLFRLLTVTPDIESYVDYAKYIYDFGSFDYRPVETINLAFVGFKLAGKTTLIQGIMNANLRLGYSNRFQLQFYPNERSHEVIYIELKALVGSKMNFNLNIYDIESFDNDNQEHNDKCVHIVSKLFEPPHNLNAICFVIKPGQQTLPEFNRVYESCSLDRKIIQLINIYDKNTNYHNDFKRNGVFLIENFAFVNFKAAEEFDFDKSIKSYDKLLEKIPKLLTEDHLINSSNALHNPARHRVVSGTSVV